MTLEDLKEQMYSLNMRMRLSMQNNDDETRVSLEQQINELQRQIKNMQSGIRDA
jgi:hypothetical protein